MDDNRTFIAAIGDVDVYEVAFPGSIDFVVVTNEIGGRVEHVLHGALFTRDQVIAVARGLDDASREVGDYHGRSLVYGED